MPKYDVFLSHNSKDKAVVEALAHRLMKEALLQPFLDRWHLVPGEPWQEAIENALGACTTCAVFMGPSGTGPWHNEEMRAALERRVANPAFRVIPVLLPGAADPKVQPLPAFLSRLTWVDFHDSIDDEDAFQRLVNGIKGQAPGPPAHTAQQAHVVVAPSATIEAHVASRLEHYGIRGEADPNFGTNDFTRHLLQIQRSFQSPMHSKLQRATSSVMFLVIPHAPVRTNRMATLETARELLQPHNWYESAGRPGPRYHAREVFPLSGHRIRTTRDAVIAEEEWKRPEEKFLVDSLHINHAAEVAYATSFHVFDEFLEGARIFRLGSIINFLWSFLCLSWEFQESIGYSGHSRAFVAMINTKGSHLGHFAEGWPNPYKQRYWTGIVEEPRETACRDANLLIYRDIDFTAFKPKVEPAVLYEMAEEIALAYNQAEARCFELDTGKLMEYRLHT